MASRTLSRRQVRAFYDQVGSWQDTQRVYESPAIEALIAQGRFGEGRMIFEVRCGTGRVADRLLRNHCPTDARYVGVDLSSTMVRIARERLRTYGDRAEVQPTDGRFSFNRSEASQDRVIATYVLDLLSTEDIQAFLAEAHRLLESQGRLCLAGITWGERPLSRLVSRLWAVLHSIRPRRVGGCRPLRLRRFLSSRWWSILHHDIVRAWGVPSEVLIARSE